MTGDPEARTPETLLRWIADHDGGVSQLAAATGVTVDTLRRWLRPGEFPRSRLTPNVEAVHSWALKNAAEEYPPSGYPDQGLLAYVANEPDTESGVNADSADRHVPEPADLPADTTQPSPGHRRPNWWIVAGVVAAVCIAIGGYLIGTSSSSPTYADLDLGALPKPPPVDQWQTQVKPCEAKTRWQHQFPDDYVGDVFVYFIAGPREAVTATVQLDWGDQYWQRTLDIQPGDFAAGQGGTLRAFKKYTTTEQNPGQVNLSVVFSSSVPTCAMFGTAAMSRQPAPIEKDFTPGWKPHGS